MRGTIECVYVRSIIRVSRNRTIRYRRSRGFHGKYQVRKEENSGNREEDPSQQDDQVAGEDRSEEGAQRY